MRQPSESDPMSGSNGSVMWILLTAIVVTVLFVSLSLYFSRSKAAGPYLGTQSTGNSTLDVANAAPTISEVVLSTTQLSAITSDLAYDSPQFTQAAIVPTASSTVAAWVYVIAKDTNGAVDINRLQDTANLGAMNYDGSLSFNVTRPTGCVGSDDYDCYRPISPLNCSPIYSGDLVVELECPVHGMNGAGLEYFMHKDAWKTHVTITDRAGASSADTSAAFTVSTVLGYTLDTTTIDFGSLTAGQQPSIANNNSNKLVKMNNVGNQDIGNMSVDHSNMPCSVGTIPAADIGYTTSTTPISTDSDFRATGVSGGLSGLFTLPAQQSPLFSIGNIYNHLSAVPPGISGTCTGTIKFTPAT